MEEQKKISTDVETGEESIACPEINSRKEFFYDAMTRLLPLYEKVKRAIVISENLDFEHKVYIAPFNELRNTLDHIFKGIKDGNNLENEIIEAEQHLHRAGYDAYEVLSINLCTHLVNVLEKYETDVISEVFPEYYKEYRVRIEEVRKELAEVRIDKQAHLKPFDVYFDIVVELHNMQKEINKKIPAMDAYAKKVKKEKKRAIWIGIWIGFGVGILLTILGVVLTYFFSK